MEPISISLELGALLLGAVGAFATWLHHRHERRRHEQRERHHQEAMAAGWPGVPDAGLIVDNKKKPLPKPKPIPPRRTQKEIAGR